MQIFDAKVMKAQNFLIVHCCKHYEKKTCNGFEVSFFSILHALSVCVNFLHGTWRMKGILFSLVLAYSSDLDGGLCSFWSLPCGTTTQRPSKILSITSMGAPCISDGALKQLMSEGRISWNKWVICWILPCVRWMWHVDERFVPAF
jgi:hypothetical protein